jgi:tRNA nucleotidyltransferase (CCA-adding enzyme)
MEIPSFIMMVLKRLHTSGHQGYVVGGAVRDYCLGRKLIDWDVATSAGSEEIKALFADVRHFALRHDTVTLVSSDHHCEITVFKGGKGFGQTIEEDLGHRDFTINAMAYDVAIGAIIDPYGGRKDLSRRLIRAVGDPYERFLEDPVRLLRAVRLTTELGYEMAPKTQQIITAMAERLNSVAEERVRDELIKILMSDKPSRGFDLMRKTGLLEHVIPELLEGYRKKQDATHRFTIYKHIMETVDHVDPDPVLRLTALFHDIGKPRVRRKIEGEFRFLGHEKVSADMSKEIMGRLKFSNKMISRVANLVTLHMAAVGYHEGWRDNALRRLIRRVGSDDMDRFLLFCRADILAHGQDDRIMGTFSVFKDRLEKVRKRPVAVKKRDLALGGRRVMDVLGLPQGPEVGKILGQLLETVIDHPEWNTKDRLEALLREMTQKDSSSTPEPDN